LTTLPPSLIHATRNPETTRIDMKVLIRLHESLCAEEVRLVRAWYVANLLQVDVSSVNRALQHLVELGYLEREGRNGYNLGYRLTSPASNHTSPTPGGVAA
jgi:DNA-binding IclR family transcriptional regulator